MSNPIPGSSLPVDSVVRPVSVPWDKGGTDAATEAKLVGVLVHKSAQKVHETIQTAAKPNKAVSLNHRADIAKGRFLTIAMAGERPQSV